MVTAIRALSREFIRGGAAGDAGHADGRHIASNVLAQLLARATTTAISVVTVSLTARTLGPSGYGTLSGVSSYVGLFGVLTDLGFTTAAMQRMTREPDREGEWLGALALARTGLSLFAMAICAATIPIFLTSTHHGHTIGFIFTITILTTGAATLMSVFQARLRAGLALSLTVVQSFLWLAIVAVLAAVHGSAVAFAASSVALAIVVAIMQVQLTRRFAYVAWRAGVRLWRPLVRVAVPLGVAGVMITIYYQIDSVLLLQLAGPRQAGIYAAAYGFLSPLSFLPAAIMSSFFPVLSAVHLDDPQRARRLVQICLENMALIGLPILAGTIALSPKIIHLLYGHEYSHAAGLLPVLMIAFVSMCFGTLAGFLAPLLGLQWRLALYSTIGALVNVGLNLLLIPRYGALGSAWVTVATEILTMTLMLGTALYALHLIPAVGKLVQIPAVAAAMTGVMFLSRPLGLVPAGVLGLAFYTVAVLVTRIVRWRDLRGLAGSSID